MKTILVSLILLSFGIAKGQNTSDYKYVIVPQNFNDFKENDYQLNVMLKTILRKKKYEVVADGASNIPEELNHNQCLATKADIQNINSAFQNKLKVIFTDCNDNIINEFVGSSKIKDFEKGYQDALNGALKPLLMANPIPQKSTIKKESQKIDLLNPTISILNNQEEDSENLYFLNNQAYILTKIGENFNLIDKATRKTVIQFYPSSKENVYHALIENYKRNYQSVAFFNDNKIDVEYQTGQNIWEVKTYTK